jgi:uncharacterized protein with HEPN domain
MTRDDATLLDIIKAARLIGAFVQDMSAADFMQDTKTQSAVQHQLLIIGEAVKRLSRHLREQHATIPWTLMAGMRDHLIHAYDAVDLEEVWNTATRDIPTLLAQLEQVLPTPSGDSA